MDNVTVFVGLDYHQAFVQVCMMDRQGQQLGNRECANDWQVITRYVARFGSRVQAAMEGCAGAADLCDELTTRAGWSVDLAHPGFVARMKQNPDKTDFQDAHLLADLERVDYLPRVWLAPRRWRETRIVTSRCLVLVRMRSRDRGAPSSCTDGAVLTRLSKQPTWAR